MISASICLVLGVLNLVLGVRKTPSSWSWSEDWIPVIERLFTGSLLFIIAMNMFI